MGQGASNERDTEATEAGDASVTLLPDGGPTTRSAAPGRLVGRYVLGHQVGSGAMGVVFRAFDPKLERYVALKLLAPETAGAIGLNRERLLREARGLARIEHPNVVTVHDVGVAGDQVFIAMEFVDGGDLKAWMRSATDPQPWREVLTRYLAAGDGLAAAHAVGLVHRDFKPANVLLRTNGRVLVSDFGLVREASSGTVTSADGPPGQERGSLDLTVTGTVLGTPAYMAPEQFRGQDADTRSDQFAFCVALWEALSRRRPFWPHRTSELYAAANDGPPDLPDDNVPRWIYRTLQRGLAVAQDDRYESMDALLAELRRGRTSKASSARWALAGALGAAVVGGIAYQAGVSTDRPSEDVQVDPPTLEEVPAVVAPLDLGSPAPLDHEAAAQELDAEAGPFEKSGVTGPEVADLQMRRAQVHLDAYEAGGPQRHLHVAHELFVRVRENVYGAPKPEELQAKAKAKLDELHKDAAGLAEAGIKLDPLTRFGLVVLQRHGAGAVVIEGIMEEMGDTVICIEPCTWAVPVNDESGTIRVEFEGEVAGRMAWNPQWPLQIPPGF